MGYRSKFSGTVQWSWMMRWGNWRNQLALWWSVKLAELLLFTGPASQKWKPRRKKGKPGKFTWEKNPIGWNPFYRYRKWIGILDIFLKEQKKCQHSMTRSLLNLNPSKLCRIKYKHPGSLTPTAVVVEAAGFDFN